MNLKQIVVGGALLAGLGCASEVKSISTEATKEPSNQLVLVGEEETKGYFDHFSYVRNGIKVNVSDVTYSYGSFKGDLSLQEVRTGKMLYQGEDKSLDRSSNYIANSVNQDLFEGKSVYFKRGNGEDTLAELLTPVSERYNSFSEKIE